MLHAACSGSFSFQSALRFIKTQMAELKTFKLFVVGESGVGKTSLLITYTTKTFPTPYLPTIYDTYVTTIEIPDEGEQEVEPSKRKLRNVGYQNAHTGETTQSNLNGQRKFQLGLWDPSGGEDFDRLRPLQYPETDVFLICFDVSNEESFHNVRNRWKPEITHYMPTTPWLLVGTKTDLILEADITANKVHGQKTTGCISADCAMMEAASLKAVKYVECSALLQKGVEEVFEEAVKAVLASHSVKKKKKCLVL